MTKSLAAVLAEIPDLVVEVVLTVGVGAPNPAARVQICRSPPSSRPPLDLDAIDLLTSAPRESVTDRSLAEDAADERGRILDPATAHAVIGQGAADSHLLDRLGMCCRLVEEERAEVGLVQPQPAYGTWSGVVGYLAATLDWWAAERGVGEDVEHDVRAVDTGGLSAEACRAPVRAGADRYFEGVGAARSAAASSRHRPRGRAVFVRCGHGSGDTPRLRLTGWPPGVHPIFV